MNQQSALGQILAGISQALGNDGRCGTCRGWGPTRVEYPDRDDDCRREILGFPEPPESCPSCGWRPFIIEVVYTPMNIDRGRRQPVDDEDGDDIST